MARYMIDLVCNGCDTYKLDQLVERGNLPFCRCGAQFERFWISAASIKTDSIPGGLMIEHGLCNPDGSPRRYDSQTEITKECNRRGLTRWSDMYEESATKCGREALDYRTRSPQWKKERAEQMGTAREDQQKKAAQRAEVTL